MQFICCVLNIRNMFHTLFSRSLVLQPKLDLNEIGTESRESPASLDNTEELLKESNKHLPGKD